ncbi:MAG: RNA polymerase sigma factor [Actinomycetota bacterium]
MAETSAVERLYREQVERLWRSVVLFAGDREVANDAVAEAFAQLLHRGGEVRAPDRWVWRAAFRIAAGELKARRRPPLPLPEPDPAPETPIDLLGMLGRLSPKQRSSVVLHHYAGYSVREVAAIVGSTPSAVGVHLHRARRRLRELLKEEDDDA